MMPIIAHYIQWSHGGCCWAGPSQTQAGLGSSGVSGWRSGTHCKEEEAARAAKVQPHVILQKTQRRLQQLGWRADKACKEVEEVDEQQSKRQENI